MSPTPLPNLEFQLLDLLGLPGVQPVLPQRRDAAATAAAAGEPPLLAVFALQLEGLQAWRSQRGEAAAARLLQLLAARLCAQLRAGDQTRVAVPGAGDADADIDVDAHCLLADVSGMADARAIARRLRAHLGGPWRLGRDSLRLRASIGMALGPAHARQRLLGEAAQALLQARSQPGGLLPFKARLADTGLAAQRATRVR